MTTDAERERANFEPRPAVRGGFAVNVLPALAWTLAIFLGGGAQPIEPSADVRLPLPFDKSEHVLAFLVLSVLGFRAVRYELTGLRRWQLALLAAGAAILVGVLLEVYQLALPDRSAEVADAVADAVGASIGALFVLLFRRV